MPDRVTRLSESGVAKTTQHANFLLFSFVEAPQAVEGETANMVRCHNKHALKMMPKNKIKRKFWSEKILQIECGTLKGLMSSVETMNTATWA